MLVFMEWDNPKDEARRTKFFDENRRRAKPAKWEGVGKRTTWADGTGHIIALWEYESPEDFAKVWNDPEYHQYLRQSYPLLDNIRVRVCRPSGSPEQVKKLVGLDV
jgi:hypothetical protein